MWRVPAIKKLGAPPETCRKRSADAIRCILGDCMSVASATSHRGDTAKRTLLLKRRLDIMLALLLLPFASVLIAVLAIAIRLTSPGPAIFRQVRVGQRETLFNCLKLRTMYQDTTDAPSHEIGGSSVTVLGKVLRRIKLDELPQLWNILRGDMSFVGPRPCLPTQTAVIEARRSYGLGELRPGITGVSQIAGVDMQVPLRLAQLDASYLTEMSARTDIRLLVRTILGAGRGDRTDAGR
jgi:O-antigen biosynthesis protein WbqP